MTADEAKPKEPTLTEIMNELKRARRAVWITPIAFGASVGLAGISILAQEILGPYKSFFGLCLIMLGWGFMIEWINKRREIKD